MIKNTSGKHQKRDKTINIKAVLNNQSFIGALFFRYGVSCIVYLSAGYRTTAKANKIRIPGAYALMAHSLNPFISHIYVHF